ncbi:MAG: hypothetical protein AB7O48_03905 [Cyclobacteriaceae bacterium]
MFLEKQFLIANKWLRFSIASVLVASTLFLIWSLLNSPNANAHTLYILTLTVNLVLLALVFVSMDTVINSHGVTVFSKPWLLKKKFSWSEVNHIEVRKIIPSQEFGHATGPGILFGYKTKAGYVIKGDDAMVLETKNNGRIVVGTQKPKSVYQFLKSLKKTV